MKALKTLLAISLAALLFTGCDKDDASKNSITFDGKTYTDMDVYYRIEGERMFWLLVEIHSDIEIFGSGQADTRKAIGEDLKGGSVSFNSETLEGVGYGDLLCMSFYGDGYDYYFDPAKGTQVTKKLDDKHYSIKMDMTDVDGKPFKMDVVAELQKEK
jgi:hypothetical protein